MSRDFRTESAPAVWSMLGPRPWPESEWIDVPAGNALVPRCGNYLRSIPGRDPAFMHTCPAITKSRLLSGLRELPHRNKYIIFPAFVNGVGTRSLGAESSAPHAMKNSRFAHRPSIPRSEGSAHTRRAKSTMLRTRAHFWKTKTRGNQAVRFRARIARKPGSRWYLSYELTSLFFTSSPARGSRNFSIAKPVSMRLERIVPRERL